MDEAFEHAGIAHEKAKEDLWRLDTLIVISWKIGNKDAFEKYIERRRKLTDKEHGLERSTFFLIQDKEEYLEFVGEPCVLTGQN